MTHVVTESCIRCKYTDCIDVCPVECFHGGEAMLVINPSTCIDCAACVPVCPSQAIVSANKPGAQRWLELNTRLSAVWPQITERRRRGYKTSAMSAAARSAPPGTTGSYAAPARKASAIEPASASGWASA